MKQLTGHQLLMVQMLYGAGLRLMECVRLRVKDLDFDYMQIVVKSCKGDKDRVTLLSDSLADDLKLQLERVRILHAEDLEQGFGEVWLPHALAKKYPSAGREWGWQYLFPATKLSTDP